jgi:hypothetical protein
MLPDAKESPSAIELSHEVLPVNIQQNFNAEASFALNVFKRFQFTYYHIT